MTNSLHPNPVGIESNPFDSCLPAREPPKIRGLGADLLKGGLGNSSPVGLGNAQGLVFALGRAHTFGTKV
ncbi:hypothetical protein X953_19935 (plasmid) [Virgibacillus sp. SK37]|nr:hypothetical protein X953_19935 [Virgibacillus sp. SK37]